MTKFALIVVAVASLVQPMPARAADLFDPAVARQTVPAKSGADSVAESRCTWYPDLMVRETGTDTPAPAAASVIPGARPLCTRAHVAGQVALDTANYSMLGRKGRFLFFGATDPNGAVPFKILDAASGRIIYADGTAADRGFASVQIENGGLRLKYTRGLNATCSIMQDAAACWSRLIAEGKIPRAMARTPPSPQACAASYKDMKASVDDPSIITYDVEITVNAAGKTAVLSRGAPACGAMP